MPDGSHSSPKKVFYSYSSVDRVRVSAFADVANSDGEIDQFLDYRELEAGRGWRQQLLENLDRSRKVKVFWSKHSARSKEVRKEYEYFASRYPERTIVPILLDETPLAGLLGEIHAVAAKVPEAVEERTEEAAEPARAGALLDLLEELSSDAEGAGGVELRDLVGGFQYRSAGSAESQSDGGLGYERRSEGMNSGAGGSAGLLLDRFRDLQELGHSKPEIRRALVVEARKICGGTLPVLPRELFYAVSPCWLASPFDPRTWWARAKSAANWVQEAIEQLTRPQWILGALVALAAFLLLWILWPTCDDCPEVAPSETLTEAVDQLRIEIDQLGDSIGGVQAIADLGDEITDLGDTIRNVSVELDRTWLEELRRQSELIRAWSETSSEDSRLLRETLDELTITAELVQRGEADAPTQEMERLLVVLSELTESGLEISLEPLILELRSLRDCACPPGSTTGCAAVEILDFDRLRSGEFAGGDRPLPAVAVALGSGARGHEVLIEGRPRLGGQNAAVVYDTSRRGADPDLGTPNTRCSSVAGVGVGEGGAERDDNPFTNCRQLRNMLVVGANLADGDGDGRVDTPDDTDDARAMLTFDFSALPAGTATVHRVDFVDIDPLAGEPEIRFLSPGGSEVGSRVDVPRTGDNGYVRVHLGPVPGVARMEVRLRGSGALDNVVFGPDCG